MAKAATAERECAFAVAAATSEANDNGLRGVVVAQRGVARGWRFWADGEFLDQVVALGNAGERGVKVRFGHGNSGGPSTFLGRAKNFRRDGDKVRADIEFAASARKTPQHGDLAGYVAELAQEDPEAFGMSIVFRRDHTAEGEFYSAHMNDSGGFESPDSDNENNFPHVRMAELRAVDVVDTPALTDGMFAARTDAARGEEEEEKMAEKKEVKLSAAEFAEADPAAVNAWRDEGKRAELARLSELREAFSDDPEFVLEKFAEGKSVTDSQGEYWRKKAEAAQGEAEKLKAELAAKVEQPAKPAVPPAVEGVSAPASLSQGEIDQGESDKFLVVANELAEKEGLDYFSAMQKAAEKYPKLAAAYNRNSGR